MFIYLIIFSYYLFLCIGVFYMVKVRSYCHYGKIKSNSQIKRVTGGFVKKINLISHKIGKLFSDKYWFRAGKKNTEIFRLLESENKILITRQSFTGYKIIFFALFMIAAGFMGSSVISSALLGIAGGVTGYFMPDILLRRFRSRRQREIDKDLPYIIDLLSIATLSGQNIYNAMKIVIEKYKGRICEELAGFIKDVDIGIGKSEAYGNLMDRNNSEDFKSFIFLLIQAEKYGSSINEVLNQKSRHIKFETYQNLERKARKMTISILFPLVFMILPSFIILVGGPLIFLIGGNFLQF